MFFPVTKIASLNYATSINNMVNISKKIIISVTHKDNTSGHYLGLMNPIDGDEHWVCPTGDTIKVNSDAAIFEASNCFSYAFVVRDSAGKLIEA